MSQPRILYIALHLYADEIVSKMRELGYQVDYFNDKPNDGFWCKTLIRFNVLPYRIVLNQYYKKLFDQVSHYRYKYIVILRAEALTKQAIKYCRIKFPEAKLILYMWDSLQNYPRVKKLWKYFDKIMTFDRKDYQKNKEKVEFLPLFYIDQYKSGNIENTETEFDWAFIGTAHADRPKIIRNLAEQSKKANRRYYSFMYLPSKIVFYFNKVFCKDYAGIARDSVNFSKLKTEECVNMYSKAKSIIDVESATQTGLTMRTIEILGMQKKLITTNRDIINYDFYNPNNIFVMDRDKPEIEDSFLDKPFIPTPQDILDRYSLENWVLTLLK